ncbi:extracellular solute-binding protein [Aureimonas psammosilenae]|uniref:extracellular solute-binding protein n=1 Tax=Aureimonas psammosilenae TaxID=2495496 RepID=UPI00126075B6|nr:extracellular solute-binding protein [Aureimonas psammosilenae]
MRLASVFAVGLFSVSGTAAFAQEPVTLTFAAHYTDAEIAPLTACFREYEKQNPNIRISYRQSEIADFLQTILTSRIGGTTPDIYNVYSIWGKRLVDNGLLAEPPAEIADFIKTNYEPSTIQSAVLDDRIWGVPAEVSLYMLVYNKELFRKAGISAPPSDWPGVIAAAEKITEKDGMGKIVTAGYAFGPTVANATHPFRALMFSNGLSIVGEDQSSTNLAKPEAVEILAGEAELFKRGLTSAANQIRDFPSGRVGMMIAANWMKDTLRQGLGDRLEEVAGVAPIPAGPDWKTFQYSFYQSVDANSKHPEEAWKLIRWLNTPAAEGKRSCTGEMLIKLGSLTANKADIAASQDELGDAFTKPYIEALQSGRAVADLNVAQTAEIDKVLRGAIESAWLGQKTAADALSQADAQVTDILAMPQ